MLLVALSFGFGKLCTTANTLVVDKHDRKVDHTVPVKIAWFGDQGANDKSLKVLQMISNWNPDGIVHLGDFDYKNDPNAFISLLNRTVKGIPYISAIGNHDIEKFQGEGGYQHQLVSWMNQTNTNCTGSYGVNMMCNIKGVDIVLSGVGTFEDDHEAFIDSALTRSTAPWKICGWHKLQNAFQTGSHIDEVGYGVYETCKGHGAIIMTAHCHSYARSKVMTSFEDQEIGNNATDVMHIGVGQTFTSVVGLGGKSIDPYSNNNQNKPYWAKTIAKQDTMVNYGALLCEFALNAAHCQFKDINENTLDDYTIIQDAPLLKYKKRCKKMIEFPSYKTGSTKDGKIKVHFNLENVEMSSIYHARIQLLFHDIGVRSFYTLISLTNSHGAINYNDEIEYGEVYNTKDVRKLLDPLTNVTIQLSVPAKVGKSGCLAPTLVIQVNKC